MESVSGFHQLVLALVQTTRARSAVSRIPICQYARRHLMRQAVAAAVAVEEKHNTCRDDTGSISVSMQPYLGNPETHAAYALGSIPDDCWPYDP